MMKLRNPSELRRLSASLLLNASYTNITPEFTRFCFFLMKVLVFSDV